jgi:hypothetical protein
MSPRFSSIVGALQIGEPAGPHSGLPLVLVPRLFGSSTV